MRQIHTCSFDGCGRLHAARGLCASHWRQQRDGKELQPIKDQAGTARYTAEEWGLISDLSVAASEVAELLGLHRVTVYQLRRKMDAEVWAGPSEWSQDDVDFLIENLGRMKLAELAKQLGTKRDAVKQELMRLRFRGLVETKLSTQRLDPWVVSDRTLLAKTCPECGLLLDAEWFAPQKMPRGKVGYKTECRRCASPATKASKDSNYSERMESARMSYSARLQAATLERAENNGQEWTQADMEILADPNLSRFQKALRLKRTYHATSTAVSKNGFSSKPDPLPDPHDNQWRLFWEFELQEGVPA